MLRGTEKTDDDLVYDNTNISVEIYNKKAFFQFLVTRALSPSWIKFRFGYSKALCNRWFISYC